MKIRLDYVTNSSSSSFVIMRATNKVLAEIFEKHKDLIMQQYFMQFNIVNDDLDLYADEVCVEIPDSKDDILRSLLGIFDNNIFWDYSDDGSLENYWEEEAPDEFIADIKANKDAILENMEYFELSNNDVGWQGDDDTRFYEDSYPEERLKEIYETIAEEKGCSVDEVDEDDFSDYVADKTSTAERVFIYDKETDKIKTTYDYYLDD